MANKEQSPCWNKDLNQKTFSLHDVLDNILNRNDSDYVSDGDSSLDSHESDHSNDETSFFFSL